MKNNSVFLLLILFACSSDTTQGIDPGSLKFRTTDASELFFRNIRQSDYLLTEVAAGKMNVYRHSKFPDSAALLIDLIQNWQQDAAYVMLHFSDSVLSYDRAYLVFNGTKNTDTVMYIPSSITDQTRFATKIYNRMSVSDTILIRSRGGYYPLFPSTQVKEAFRITMRDYFRLTEVL